MAAGMDGRAKAYGGAAVWAEVGVLHSVRCLLNSARAERAGPKLSVQPVPPRSAVGNQSHILACPASNVSNLRSLRAAIGTVVLSRPDDARCGETARIRLPARQTDAAFSFSLGAAAAPTIESPARSLSLFGSPSRLRREACPPRRGIHTAWLP